MAPSASSPLPADRCARLAGELAKALAPAGGDKVATAELWDEHFENVYALADAVMDRVVAEA